MLSDLDTITFPDWQNVLSAAALPTETKAAYLREILAFLQRCKTTRAPASIGLARRHLTEREQKGAVAARPALRWFFQTAPSAPVAGATGAPAPERVPDGGNRPERRSSIPPTAAADTGGADWERDLIKATRTTGRTESGQCWVQQLTSPDVGAGRTQISAN